MAEDPKGESPFWNNADLLLKQRELDLREAELKLKKRELQIKQRDSGRLQWSVPLAVALIGLVSVLVSTCIQSQQQRNALELEKKRFRYDVQRAHIDRTMNALENYSLAYTKGSTLLIVHTAQLAPDISRALAEPLPSYDTVLKLANRYEDIANERIDWQSQTGPCQSVLEVLSGHKGPSTEFTSFVGLPGFVDKSDVKKRKDLLVLIQRDVAKLQTALLNNSRDAIAFMDSVQKSLTKASD